MLFLKVLKLFLCSFDSVILILFLWKEIYFCLSKSLIQSVGSLPPFINQVIKLILRSMFALLKILQLLKFPSSDYSLILWLQRGNFHIEVSTNDYIILEIVERFSLSMEFSFLSLHCFCIALSRPSLKILLFIELEDTGKIDKRKNGLPSINQYSTVGNLLHSLFRSLLYHFA